MDKKDLDINDDNINKLKIYFKNILIYKLIDISFIVSLYFISAFFMAMYLDKLNDKLFNNKVNLKKSIPTLLYEIIISISITAIITFIFRNIALYIISNNHYTIGNLLYITFNNDDNNRYDVSKIKEVEGFCGAIFMGFSLSFQNNLMDKLNLLKYKIKNINETC